MTICTYLVCRVGAEDVQRWRDELGLDGDSIAALGFTCAQSLLDSIDTGRSVAGKLDVSTELNRLRCEAASNGGHEDVLDVGRDRVGELGEDNVGLAAYI